MGQVNSTDYNGRHVTSFHIKALGIKFTKKSKKKKQLNDDVNNQEIDHELSNQKVKNKKRSLLSYLGKHLKLTKKKNVVKSSSKQLINQNKLNHGYVGTEYTNSSYNNEYIGDYNPKSSQSIDESIVNELNNKLTNQQSKLANNQSSQPNENKIIANELDNELTDVPLDSETNSLTNQEVKTINDSAKLNNNLFNANDNQQTKDNTQNNGSLNKNRLSSTFSTYDLKAQLNNPTTILSNTKDQQIKLSSMLNRRSFKNNKLSPLNDKNGDCLQPRDDSSILSKENNSSLNNLFNSKNTIRPADNNLVQKNNNFQNKRLLTEASNAISAISTMRSGIILTSGQHGKPADFNNQNNLQLNNEKVSNLQNQQPQQKTNQTSSQTKTIIQVDIFFISKNFEI